MLINEKHVARCCCCLSAISWSNFECFLPRLCILPPHLLGEFFVDVILFYAIIRSFLISLILSGARTRETDPKTRHYHRLRRCLLDRRCRRGVVDIVTDKVCRGARHSRSLTYRTSWTKASRHRNALLARTLSGVVYDRRRPGRDARGCILNERNSPPDLPL